MINQVTLIGNLGRDPESWQTNDKMLCKLSLATNENYKDKNDVWQTSTQWHTVEIWGQAAALAERMMRKGQLVYITGSIKYSKYENDAGEIKYKTVIVCQTFKTLEAKREVEELAY